MSANKKTLIDGDFQVGSGHFYVDVENNRVGLNQMNPTSSLDVNGNAYIATDMTIGSNVLVGSNVIAQKFTGSASGLTSIPADQISGVISVANGGTGTSTSTGTGDLVKSDTPTFTGTVTAGTFSGSGASLTNIPLDQVTGVLAVLNGGTGVTTTTGTGSVVYSESPTLTGTVVADGANFSSNISVSNVYAGYNTDTTSYLGRAAVGFSGITDEATFAHIDVNSTNNYALKQTATGGTHVNAATTKSVIFSINDSEQARINTTGVGIGTDNPSYKLDVHGTANVGALTCTTVSGDGSGLLNVPGFSWPTHANGVDIYHITGNVGIGTTTPGTTLEVAGTAGVAILKSAASAAISTYNFILNGPRPGTTSGGAIHFINGSTRTGDGDGSTYTIRNDSGKLRLGNASYDTLLEGNVGIGVMIPNSKLQVNGTVTASSFSGIQVDDVPTLDQNTSGSAASLTTSRTIFGQSFNGTDAVTGNLVFGTGATNKGTIAYPTDTVRTFTIPDTGAAANFVMTEGNQTIGGNKEFSSRIILGTSASIRQSSTGTWTGDPGSGVGKLEYYSNRWYIVAGSNSTELLQIRRNDTNKFTIDNNGSVSLGFVPWARLTGVQTLTRGSYLTGDNYNGGTARTWAVDATTDATVSKIVARDSGGDINARYVNGSYMNMSHGASARNSDTIFYSSNDNYIRKTTASGMRSSLGLANSATITATSANTVNQICQRNSSGDIFCRLFRSDYTDQNDCGAGIAFRNSTSDNYIRFCNNMGAVRSRIGAYGNGSNITRTSHSNGFLVGSYNSVGTNDAKTNPIYTIGSSFQPSDTSLSNMYGIGYSHGNFTSMLTGGWGLYVASDGNIRIGLNASHGHIKCTGYVDVGGVIGINGLDSNVPLTIQSNKTINVGGGIYTSYCRWYRGSGNWYIGSDNSTSWNQNLYWFANIATSGNPLAKVIMFENDQSKGTNINANTFTGQHRNIVKGVNPTNIGTRVGLIVSADNNENIKVNGGVERGLDAITINETIPYVSVTTKPYDKRVFGVISGSEDPESREDKFGRVTSVFIKEEGDDRIFINSLGEGAMWISNQNGPLESGDYVTSSNMPGYGMKQDSEFLANYTVAKITMNCDFQATLRVKYRIKTELKNVNYYRHEESFLKEYEYNKLEPDTQSKYSLEQYDENVNILDEYGQLQWEDSSETEAPYKVRYLLPDGTQISEEKYTTKAFANEEVYIAAFVGCTYHCG